ncbi:MAG: lipopolysaccharide biosynthesis protein [Maribacter sp.]
MGLGDKMFKGMAWSAIEKVSVQAIQFFIQIALARILTPSEYGTVGLLYVFIAISMVFIDSGFTKALIQKKNRSENDISTVFLFNIGISLIAYGILFFVAPFVSDFYDIEKLTLLLRVLAISMIINALFSVPMTLYTIKLNFRVLTKINIISSILSGIVAYSMALFGYGVWALVALTLLRSIITAILSWVMLKWKPNWVFSKKSFKELFSFGSNILVSSLLDVTVNKTYELVIPKVSSVQDLGYYSRGAQNTGAIFNIINSIFHSVLLPSLTDIQDKLDLLVSHTRQIIKTAALLIIPVFLFLAAVAEPLVRVLLTEKWMPSVIIMQIFCFARMVSIISGININILYVLGRSDLVLKQQYAKIFVRVILLVAAFKFGIIYIALAELVATLVHFFINTYYPGKIMKYGATTQIKDTFIILLCGIIMVLSVFCGTWFVESDILKLIIAPIIAIPVYIGLVQLFKIKEYVLLKNKILEFTSNRK